ncbi:arginine--tRNA ligase, partial [Bordetella hinzii]|nr:arginine--tRNA ligase [Bordetella hinzii]
MLPEQQQHLISLLARAVAGILPEAQPDIQLERPKVAAHGDIATNVAMQLAKPAKRNPRELAQGIVDALLADPQARDLIDSAEIAGPGFINLRFTAQARQAVIATVAAQGEAYGR